MPTPIPILLTLYLLPTFLLQFLAWPTYLPLLLTPTLLPLIPYLPTPTSQRWVVDLPCAFFPPFYTPYTFIAFTSVPSPTL